MLQDPLLSNFVDKMFGVGFLAYANEEIDNIKTEDSHLKKVIFVFDQISSTWQISKL